MRSTNSISYNELQFKIDNKLQQMQKRKIHSRTNSGKSKDPAKVLHLIKWNTINRQHMQQYQKQKNPINNDVKVVKPLMKAEELKDIINRVMLLQKSLIELSKSIGDYRRLQIACIFFQCSLSIVFNAYNLVVFLLIIANDAGDVPLSLAMLVFFYGYHIASSLSDIIISVSAYHGVYESIRKTASIADELNMYILEGEINARISQLSSYVYNNLRTFTLFGLYNIDGTLITSILSGTITYIIILIQYSDNENFQYIEHLNTNTSKT
ncbi:putative gustatory receptor 28b [Lucilia cuprina]|uniref:putative gustatory receptor 28b n=1 Tax=Lucilia cuprina TaxID=7375 RepID=UPI001F054D8E|nr:putative gustatory receptor 28b [Lucilia cuprina]